jgi:hypothetical protein
MNGKNWKRRISLRLRLRLSCAEASESKLRLRLSCAEASESKLRLRLSCAEASESKLGVEGEEWTALLGRQKLSYGGKGKPTG